MSKIYEFSISRKLSILLALCCVLGAVLLFVAGTMSGLLLSPRYSAYTQPKSKAKVAELTPAPTKSGLPGAQQPAAKMPALSAAAPPQASAGSLATVSNQPSSASVQPTSAPTSLPPAAAPAQPLSGVSAAGMSPTATKPATSLGAETDGSENAEASETPVSAATLTGGTPAAIEALAKKVTPPPPDPYAISLVVQVGSFTVEENAKRLADSLLQLGYPAEIVQRTDTHQRLWYVVRLGPYRQWNAATGVATKLALYQELKPIVGPM